MTQDSEAPLATGEVYVDGAWAAAAEARVSPFDRGYLFGDGVYEVVLVLDGKLVDFAAHIARLDRSLAALSLPKPAGDAELLAMMRSLVARNAVTEGAIYLQITRGVAPRSFDWPSATRPTLFAFIQDGSVVDAPAATRGISVALVEDRRWKRRDIKTINLLPASWAKAEAAAQGADEAWMVEQDATGAPMITEGSSNNAYIVDGAGRVITRPLSTEILHGVTRAALLTLADEDGVELIERPFSPEEARSASEAFLSSARGLVTPVVQIDGATIGDGAPGPITRRLRALYLDMARKMAI